MMEKWHWRKWSLCDLDFTVKDGKRFADSGLEHELSDGEDLMIPKRIVPLISDTESKPTAAMRQAIANAEVGDEQRGEDPTVNQLQQRVAELLGKEAALWFPGHASGRHRSGRLPLRAGSPRRSGWRTTMRGRGSSQKGLAGFPESS
jgi:hypothetical protein